MCVQRGGVGVLGVGRVGHVLGSGILQICYTPTWGVGRHTQRSVRAERALHRDRWIPGSRY